MKRMISILFFTIFLCSFSFAETNSAKTVYNEKETTFNINYATKVIHNLLGIELSTETLATLDNTHEYSGVVYLTFDDGPVPGITDKILDILKEYDVQATFFNLGSYVKKNPELTKRAYDEGHTIASHSYSHRSEMFSSLEKFKNEIINTSEAIEEAVGEKPKFFRTPYGTKLKDAYKEIVYSNGMEFVSWNCETYDSRKGEKTTEDLLNAVKSTMPKKKDVIVIMHDTYGKQHTVDALPSIIEYFQSINYEFRKF